MLRKMQFLLLCAAICVSMAFGQDEEASSPAISQIRLIPGYGLFIADSAELFNPSINGELFLHHRLKELPYLTFGGALGYNHFNLIDDTNPTALMSGGVQVGVDFEILNRFVLEAFIWGGVYHGRLLEEDIGQTGLFITEAVTLNYDISPSVRLGVGGAFRNYFNLSTDMNVFANIVYRLDYKLNDPLRVLEPRPDNLYQRFIPRYNQGRTLLTLALENPADVVINAVNAEISGTYISMDTEASLISDEIQPMGNSVLFFNAIIDPERFEAGEDIIEVEVRYRYKGWPMSRKLEIPLTGRQIDFSSDPLAYSLFVNSADRTIGQLADYADQSSAYQVIDNIDRGLQLAQANYLLMQNWGFQNTGIWNSLQSVESFPRFPDSLLSQDELSNTEAVLLYLALLDSQGVETGYILEGDTMLAAVKLQVPLHRAETIYSKTDWLIEQEEGLWLPVDLSALSEGFVPALGAAQLKLEGMTNWTLYPLLHGRVEHGETAFSNPPQALELDDAESFAQAFVEAMSSVVDWTVEELEADYRSRIASNPRNITLMNNLGVLLASNGRLEQADELFNQALLMGDDKALYVNLGNVAYISGSLDEAAVFFEKATRLDPFNPIILLGQARVNYELENYGVTTDSFNKLELIDSELAQEFNYLSERNPSQEQLDSMAMLRRRIYWLEK